MSVKQPFSDCTTVYNTDSEEKKDKAADEVGLGKKSNVIFE